MQSSVRKIPVSFLYAVVLGAILAGWASPAKAGAPQQQKFTNRLVDSNNPYLLLHAHNPVDWYPWGPEAIAKARRENKPIFLSLGYSTCYWCHVAERTLYANPEIAALMNEWFVNVKVDREQRPDLDEVYMLARNLIAGDGGWPNNVFLTPDLKPFYAGSYFPPETDHGGRPGFPDVLRALHQAWTSRKSEVLAIADEIHRRMQAVQKQMTGGGNEAPIAPPAWLAAARNTYVKEFDTAHGGSRSLRDGTKFPQAPMLALLLLDYRMNAKADVLQALSKTLDAMAYGGIYDHLAGGFHRYTVESTWSVPHFEKMLYDNAQLLALYAEAYQTTTRPLYRYIAEDIATYLTQQMMSPQGGFYTAQDAQVDGLEGASYRWRREDIERILGAQAAERFFHVFQLTPVAQAVVPTGLDDDVGGVLRVRLPIEGTLQRAGFNDPAEMMAGLEPLRQKLLRARNKRPQPLRDEKLNVDLNGLAIDAFVASGRALGRPRYFELAQRAAERVWKSAYDPATGRLMHQIFRERAQTEGFLADYALFGRALMALHEATGDSVWRTRAAALADSIIKRFLAVDGQLAMTADEAGPLPPIESAGDRTYPSGTSAAIDLLLRLSKTKDGQRYATSVAKALQYYSGRMERFPEMWATAVVAVNTANVKHVIAAGSAASTAAASGGPVEHNLPKTSDYVQVSAQVRESPNEPAIVVTLTIAEGYHVNANPASFDYLIPTTVSFEGIAAARIAYPGPVLFKPSFTDEALKVYDGTPAITATFRRGSLDNLSAIRGTVKVQACNDRICLPPSTLPVSIMPSERTVRSAVEMKDKR